jgi:cephalosporin hydroxylase
MRPVTVAPELTIAEYWRARARQHTTDQYLGITLSKFPEDLRVYEQLLWLARPDVVVELGAQFGASALWLRDRLRTLAAYGLVSTPRVISVDLELAHARAGVARVDPVYSDTIAFLEGDVCDPDVRRRVGELVGDRARCLVIEDSAHTAETTAAALRLYSDLVPAGGFFIVEDGCVDVEWMRVDPTWPRGVLPAIDAWLTTTQGASFEVRRDLEIYGMTCHPGGFLQRVL